MTPNFVWCVQGDCQSLCALQLCWEKSSWTEGAPVFWALFPSAQSGAIYLLTAVSWKWWPVFHWLLWTHQSCVSLWWQRYAHNNLYFGPVTTWLCCFSIMFTSFDTGSFWVHHWCAVWSEGVQRGEGEELINVDKAVISGIQQVD